MEEAQLPPSEAESPVASSERSDRSVSSRKGKNHGYWDMIVVIVLGLLLLIAISALAWFLL